MNEMRGSWNGNIDKNVFYVKHAFYFQAFKSIYLVQRIY